MRIRVAVPLLSAGGWFFDHPMYLVMNIACRGPDEAVPDDSKLRNS
jgi:hypothetical protein